jgi:hypothetical protein
MKLALRSKLHDKVRLGVWGDPLAGEVIAAVLVHPD